MAIYDQFEPLQILHKEAFSFYPSRFEIWQKGKMIESGKTTAPIAFEIFPVTNGDVARVNFKSQILKQHLSDSIEFDEVVTLPDRLQYIIVPAKTNADCAALVMLRHTFGATRPTKNFNDTEPYCCNLFLEKGVVTKLTFSFSNPEKLIEFYSDPSFIPLEFTFESSDHLRYENGIHVSGPHGGAKRAVKVEPNIDGHEGYTVTIYNRDGVHPLWQNNVQMAPKRMKLVEKRPDRIILRGYGYDSSGASFADYGMSLLTNKEGRIVGCVLHMHNRGTDIEYLP